MSTAQTKASLLLRVIAKMIDFVIAVALTAVIPRVGYLAGPLYLLISDGLFDGRSPGKKMTGLKVVSLSDKNKNVFRDSVRRNIIVAGAFLLYEIPLIGWLFMIIILLLEFLLMLGNSNGMRLGDDIANTMVIEG
ncbi:MAG: RDD family protein [Nitrospirae bacterium]|nr:RDD family protein [Nitrospirota bacterium]